MYAFVMPALVVKIVVLRATAMEPGIAIITGVLVTIVTRDHSVKKKEFATIMVVLLMANVDAAPDTPVRIVPRLSVVVTVTWKTAVVIAGPATAVRNVISPAHSVVVTALLSAAFLAIAIAATRVKIAPK